MLRIPSAVAYGPRCFVACITRSSLTDTTMSPRFQSTKRPTTGPSPVTPASTTSTSSFKAIPAEPQHPPSSKVAPVNVAMNKATLQSPGLGSTPPPPNAGGLDCEPKPPVGSLAGRLFKSAIIGFMAATGTILLYAMYDPKQKAQLARDMPFMADFLNGLPDLFGNSPKDITAPIGGARVVAKDSDLPLNRKFADVKNQNQSSPAIASTSSIAKLADSKNPANSNSLGKSSLTAGTNNKTVTSDPTSPTAGADSKTRAGGIDFKKEDKLRPTSQSAYQSPPPPSGAFSPMSNAPAAVLRPPSQSQSPEDLIRAQTSRIEELEKQVRELGEFQRRDTDEFTMRFRQLSAEAIERARRKAQSEVIIDEKDLEEALSKQRSLLDEEFQKHIFSLRESFESELRRQLKRQVTVHSETMHEQLQKQENELLHQFESNLRIEMNRQRNEFDREVAGSIARLRGIESAVDARADAERQFKQAQDLWHACHVLNQTFLANTNSTVAGGDPKATATKASTPFGKPKPLGDAVRAVNEASLNHPFVKNITQSMPVDALTRGTSSEEELRDRFDRVRRVARRLAMVGDDVANASIFRYFLSYLQSFLMVEPAWISAAQTKQVQEGELSTVKILALARKSLENGDLESATRLVNQLTGLPRVVASDWLQDARLYLETRQAISLLLAHAQAIGLGAVPGAGKRQ